MHVAARIRCIVDVISPACRKLNQHHGNTWLPEIVTFWLSFTITNQLQEDQLSRWETSFQLSLTRDAIKVM
jgi:hypothetical protein